MANNASTLKRIRQDAKKEARGKSQRTALKNAKKKFINAVQAGDKNAEQLLNDAYKAIDKAVAQNHIHENKAARDKSRLAKKLNA
ncbi:30S ribosomal protein S20 [Dolosigranulum savutiense]|uniref:Small ribosomal subunit protein bS20 n=1 Tax=Dolosigranulum savutiense TaxID=3110288 RepID=A0AB74TZ85_9LACT